MKAPFLKINITLIAFLFAINTYSQVVLNELMVRPPGTVATPPNGLIYNSSQEYIEIYNSGCSQVNISGYFIAMKQSLSGTNTGGTYRIPNVPAAILDPGEHVVIGSANPGGTVIGNIDIPMAAADYCIYNGNYVLANTDGWCALYNASGVAIDCVYWSSSASNLTSNTSDFNPGSLCLPTGSPAITLQTPFQLNTSNPSIVRYGGINPIAGSPLSRQQDGSNTWVQNLASSIAANNCNGGTCVTPSSAPTAPTVTTPVNYCLGATAVPLVATPSSGGTLNWYGTNATGGTASSTAPTPSTSTAGSITYYVSQTVTGCESPRAPIVVTVTSGGNLGLFCDTANSTPTSLAFDFSNVGQTNFSISYSINGGAPINVTHTSPSNYTVSGLNPGDSVTLTLTANGVSCVQPQTVTCSTVPVDCGSCTTPNCPIIGVANYGVRNFPAGSCSSWSPALTNNVVKNYYLVQADANGFVGLIQQANGSPALCISRTAILRPLSTSCNVASNVNPSVVNANGVASGFNPEWYGLTPNAQYIIEVTITLGAGCTLSSLCSNYYGCTNPSAPTASATIQPTCTTPTGTIVVSSPTGAGNLYSIDGINFQASATFSGLAPNTYSVIVKKSPSGCTSSATNVTINAIPTISAPIASATAQPTCSINTGTIVVSSPIGANFEYSINGTTFQSSSTFSGLTPNTYNVIVKNLTTGCISLATSVTINPQPITPAVPTISSVAASCSATGSSAISNYSVSNTYTFTPVGPTVGAAGVISGMTIGTSYTVTATNGGCTSVASASFSNVAQLTVPATPIISSVAATCSAAGSSSISNYVAGISYVFTPSGPTVAVGGAISGMVIGTSYTVSASNGSCSSSISASFSNVAQLTVPATPIISSVAATCSAAGSSSISNYVAGISYVFTPSGPTVAVGGAISGMVIGTSYTVSASNGSCSSSISASFSNIAQLTVPATPIISSVAATCSAAGSSSISNYTSGVTYVFSPSGPTVLSGGLISGMSLNSNYIVSASNGNCLSLASLPFSNASFSIPTVIATNLNPTFCSGGSTNIQLTSNVPGATFSWTVTGGNVVGSSGGTGNAINQVLTVSAGTTSTVEVVYTIIAEANGCSGPPQVVRVQVNPIPDLTVASSTAPICSGETTNISFTGTIPGTVFSWVVTNVIGVAGASNGTGTSIQQTLTATGLSQGSVTYEITPIFNGCTGTPQSVTVLVNPRPELFADPTHPPLCSGEDTFIIVSSFNPNTTLDWTVNPVGVDGALSGTATGSTTIEQVLTTTVDNVAGYVDYIITPTLDGCSGAPITVRVIVNPLPKPVVTDGAICVDEFGATFQTYTLNSGLDNATYDFVWYLDGVAIPNSNNATYTANTVGTYSVIATNTLTNCVSEIVSANITATTPATSFTITQSEYFTGNAVLTVNVTGGSGTLMYSLDEGTLQSSNVFTNVSAGPHTITVVDTQGCTYLVQTVFVINYPLYFTPNGDGINDGWFIAGLQDTDVIYIFDRYGKLIKQLKGEEKWDGTYNQVQLPSTDYWFTVDYDENGAKKQFKAHFAMKR